MFDEFENQDSHYVKFAFSRYVTLKILICFFTLQREI